MKPQVSVILPYHNSEETLSESIESIINQDFTDLELILIDNNSTDNSYEIAAQYTVQDKRINLISEPEQGIVKALNTGIDASKGKYIARMDADDISLPNRLSMQHTFLDKNPDTGLVACCAEYSGDRDLYFGFLEYVKWNNNLITHQDISVNRFVESPIIHPTVMFRKKLVEKYGTYKEGSFPEDYELWLRWLKNGVQMHKLSEKLLIWKDSKNRLSRKDDRYSETAFFEVKSNYLYDWLKVNNPYHPKVVVWGAGRKSRQRFSLLHDLGVLPKFYIDLRANPTRNVIEYNQTPAAGKHFVLNYIANNDAREKIKEFLVNLGYTEGKDFISVA